jgi:hypothetical protein
VKITQVDGHHLLCLNQHEALMMARVFQVALLHNPTCAAMQQRGEFATFHHQMIDGLAHALAGAAAQGATGYQVRTGDSTTSAGGAG